MNMHLTKGSFEPKEALDLLSSMVQAKIRFHENKISEDCREEEVEMRERQIRKLQEEWHELSKAIRERQGKITLDAAVAIA